MGKAVGSPWRKTTNKSITKGMLVGRTEGKGGEEGKPSRELFSLEKEGTRNLKGGFHKWEHSSFKRQTSTVGTKPKISFAGLQVGSYLPERGRGCNLIHSPRFTKRKFHMTRQALLIEQGFLMLRTAVPSIMFYAQMAL